MNTDVKLVEAEFNLRAAVEEMSSWEDPYVEFYKRGITGNCGDAEKCVVAVYLSTVTDMQVDVDGKNATGYVGWEGTPDVKLPYDLVTFIREFDNHRYPELVTISS